MTTIYFGIDPGISGAVARIVDGHCCVVDMPTKKKKINFIELVETIISKIEEVQVTAGTYDIRIAVEKQSFFKEDGKPAIWTNAMGYATILNALTVVNMTHPLSVQIVKAQTWKAKFGLLVTASEVLAVSKGGRSAIKNMKKRKTEAKVNLLYPDADIYGPRKGLRDGRSDAIMIATWMATIDGGSEK